MYKIKGLIICLVLLFSCTIIGCSNSKEREFESFIENLNSTRKSYMENIKDVDIFKYMKELDKKPFSDEEAEKLTEIKYLGSDRLNNKVFTIDEAKEDIEYAFKILKYSYGAYEFFGGDEVFNKKKNELLLQIEALDIIKVDSMRRLMIDNLNFINDGHFKLGEFPINTDNSSIYAYSDELIFLKDDRGYFTYIDNKKYYLKYIDEDDYTKYLKSTIDENGALAYKIGILIRNKDNEPTVRLSLISDTKQEIEKEVKLKKSIKNNESSKIAFKEESIDDIKVLKSMRMTNHDNQQDKSLYEFIESGKKLANEDVIILDLRGNLGGGDEVPYSWFINYFGKEPSRTYTSGSNVSQLSQYSRRTFNNYYNIVNESSRYVEESIENEEYGQWYTGISKGEWIDNDNLVFVLIDDSNASSCETLISYLRNVENVIFVGTNTEGCTISLNTCSYSLPNSNIGLSCGLGIMFMENRTDLEGRGFEPDIWIDSSKALDATVRLINYYNLNKK